MSAIAQYLRRRFPEGGLQGDFREEISRICNAFVESGLSDPKFQAELTGGSDSKFWSCVSEALIFDRLRHKQFLSRSAPGTGPDFLLAEGDRRVWVEVVCPEPAGIPRDWTEIKMNTVGTVPHGEILLRWTSAIKDKTEKLVGSGDGKVIGYVPSGVVSDKDVYVIAVNGCQLRHGPFSALRGISQFPYAVEAVFPIGPYQIRIDKDTLKTVGHGYQERFSIPKPNGASVPSSNFLDPCYRMVSAVWAVDFNGCSVIGSDEPSALIHNPNALNPLTKGFLPADEEYVATPTGDGEYIFGRIEAGKKSDS